MINIIDSRIKKVDFPVMVIIKDNNYVKKSVVYENIPIKKLEAILANYLNKYKINIWGDTWAECNHIGFFIDFEIDNIKINIRLFNLCKEEIERVNKMKK